MHQAVPLNPGGPKMSACSEFVEHIWKPASCKNCFCLRSEHPPAAGRPGSLPPPPRLPPRPEACRPEDEGVSGSPYSKPTIAVKPTMMSAEGPDVWSEAAPGADVPQVIWRAAPSKQEEAPRAYLSSFRAAPKPGAAPADGGPRCPPAYALVGLHSLELRAERSAAFHPVGFPDQNGGREAGATFSYQELTATQESFRQKLAAFAGMASGCAKGPGPCFSAQPLRGSVPSEDDSDQRHSPSGDSDGGEYCSILDCCPGSPIADDPSATEGSRARHGGGDRSPSHWDPGTRAGPPAGEKHLSLPRERCSQDLPEGPGRLAPRQRSPPLEAASSCDGLSCDSSSSGSAPHLDSDYCSLVKEPTPGKQPGLDRHGGMSSRCPGLSGEPQLPAHPRGATLEPIYAESTKRRKAGPPPSRPQAEAEQARTGSARAQRAAPGWARDGEGPEAGAQVAATITVMAAHPEEDHRTIYLSSPDSAVGVQWPRRPGSQDCEAGDSGASAGQGPGCRDGRAHEARESVPTARPAIPPKLSRGSSGGSPVPPSASLLADLSDRSASGALRPQPVPRGPANPVGPHPVPRGPADPVGSHPVPRGPADPVGLHSVPKGPADPMGSHPVPRGPANSVGPQPVPRGPANPMGSHPVPRGPADPMGSHPVPRGPADPTSSCRVDAGRASPPIASTMDQRWPRLQAAAWSHQCRIVEEEELGQVLPGRGRAGGVDAGPAGPSSSSTWHRLRPPEAACGQSSKAGAGMSKSASFAFEFPKDRSGLEAFSPPPPPPKSRHLLKMNKSSSDLEKASQGSAESLSPSFRGVHVSFTAGSSDSLASDSRTCSDGGPPYEPAPSPTNSGKQLFPSVPFPSGSTEDVSPRGTLQPPPLPQKKVVSRTASSPDGFWTQGSPKPRAASPKLNLSHSETNICVHEDPRFYPSSPGSRPQHASPSEKPSRGSGPWAPAPPTASSPLSMASQAAAAGSQLQLHSLLGSVSSREATCAKLGELYAQSLLRLAAKCEDLFMGGQKTELHFSENNWSLFKLTCNKPCCDSGDAIYYCATCSEDPGSTYAVKICKTPEPKAASCCSPSVPVHFNIQQDCGHFVASVPSSMLGPPDAPRDAPPAPAPAQEQDCVVVITREVPHQTAADFVRGSAASHQAEPDAYERRVCLLLLQLCHGLEHLKEHRVIHRDLCLENLLLVHCAPRPTPGPPGPAACRGAPAEKRLPRLIISNFLRAKQKPGGAASPQQQKSQARLAPEIVSATQYRKFDEFQTGILIYELLHQPNPFEVRAQLRERDYRREDLPPLPALSLYSPGLQRLAHLLLEADPARRIGIGEAKRALQCLLWGPRRELAEQLGTPEEALRGALQNWIDVKRALMMVKFAEKAVERRREVELEDWLCCQYLVPAQPAALLQTLKLLQLL
ncbi:inactive tyrosine-protein kinase PRAG1 [Dasypus novemcinctus]|uniref:inactive tyrosine-protein kinase PRAG1 n=1 Tax=Dasypus novemcinctus TaxID=9361 RepID=UPI00265FDBEE|nr:inactive tyrosine-protein kinase PRAG1 [Dasypus novemcinctus]XP_058146078.1 inactive tyrosine-protein kinase PRAG1 [Dasypus novemcinctus]